MNRRAIRLILVALISIVEIPCNGQGKKLKSTQHGLDMIYRTDVTKEELILDLLFIDGIDEKVDVIRFDNVGNSTGGTGPLIISSNRPVANDSFGIHSVRLQKDSLKSLVNLIKRMDTKLHENLPVECIQRVTFRQRGKIYQYYIAREKVSTEYFKKIEAKLRETKSEEALTEFYRFIWPTDLMEHSQSGRRWIY
jgi:hypothetical protein